MNMEKHDKKHGQSKIKCPLKGDYRCSECSFWVEATIGDRSFHACAFIKIAHTNELILKVLEKMSEI